MSVLQPNLVHTFSIMSARGVANLVTTPIDHALLRAFTAFLSTGL